jgi:hypothetical protein
MPELEKAFLKFENKSEKLEVLFNPEKISINKSNKWEDNAMPGRPASTLDFLGASSGTMNLTLLFDTTTTGQPVTKYTSKLLAAMDIDKTLPGTSETDNNGRPPWFTFHWGQLVSFPAVIESANVTFDYFSSTGIPLRASVDLSLKQFTASDAFTRQNPTSGTPHPHRIHRVQRGETLDRISARYYGDPTRWRTLALANGIEDPLGIRPGSVLTIPQLS